MTKTEQDIRARLEELGLVEDTEFLHETLVEYVASSRELREELREALERAELTRVARIAHRIAGASATLGATELARIAAALEMAADKGDARTAGVIARDAQFALEAAIGACEAIDCARTGSAS